MATKHPSDGRTVPGVDPGLQQKIDPDYDVRQEGSVPLDSVSVKADSGRSWWPVIWAVVTIVMIVITAILLFG